MQAGGSDLVFPHHEMCAGHAQVATGAPFARVYVHAGMVGYDGEKMSKSRGNLVFVSALRNSDIDPMAIRLALLRHHYRERLGVDRRPCSGPPSTTSPSGAGPSPSGAGAPAAPVVDEVLAALADDLDAPRATAAIDAWVAATLGDRRAADTSDPGRRRARCCRVLRRAARAGRSALAQSRSGVVVAAPLEVALELPRDRLTGRLGEVGGVARLLEGADVVGDVLVLLGELVDAALPGARVLGEVAERDRSPRAGPRAGRAARAWPWGTAAGRRSAGRRPSTTPPGCRA